MSKARKNDPGAPFALDNCSSDHITRKITDIGVNDNILYPNLSADSKNNWVFGFICQI